MRPKLSAILVGLAALLAAVPADASLAEDLTSHAVTYQFDGETLHDAPDACGSGDPEFPLPLGGSTDGMLVPGDDMADIFLLEVDPADVGVRVRIVVSEQFGAPNADLMAYVPGCPSDVLNPANWPFPFPTPPAPADGQRQLTLENLAGPWDCSSSGWTFKLNSVQGITPPAAIHVAWTDGGEGTLALGDSNGGVARYSTSQHLAVLPTDAWANLPATWDGHFRIEQGPCDATDGGAVYGDPPTLVGDVLSFTPIRTGGHEVRVSYNAQPEAVQSIPLSCHFCLGPSVQQLAEKAGYRLSASQPSG